MSQRAVASGADLLGVAGGDGTQALVAGVAARYDLPFMVISAGTRNHFALDLGLDRDDPSTCLDALTDGVAETLSRLAGRAQVITITHLPQIARRADRHFRVEKVPGDPTHTRIEELGPDERRDELERMLGGREFLATVAEEDRG